MNNLHLCVITGQPLANLIPLLQEKPEHVILLHTADKYDDARAFMQTLQVAGFSPDQLECPGKALPAHSFEAILEYMLELRQALADRFPGTRLTWNATGGTKQMALAIWEALDRKTDRVIYSNTRDGHLEELIPQAGSIALESLLTPELYLQALGKIKRHAESDRDSWRESATVRRSATLHLGDHVEALATLIQQFNRSKLDANQTDPQWLTLERVGRNWQKALDLLEKGRVLDPMGNGRYAVVSADGGHYLTGGWLEEYIWHTAQAQQVDYIESGLKFGDLAHRKKGEDNEIDTFIVHCNRLLLIECKSGWMGQDTGKDSNIIYKLDSIGSHAGGTQATRLLVSAQPLQHETRQGRKVDTRARASATDIHTLEAGELKTLGKRIAQWKESGQWGKAKN